MKPSDIIKSLRRSQSLRIFCPHCEESIRGSKAVLFTEVDLSEGAEEFLARKRQEIEEMKGQLLDLRKKKLEKVQRSTQSSNLGKILERFVPILPGFMFKPEESVPLLDPVDYIAFQGSSRARVEAIAFMDVKTGNARLSATQKAIVRVIERGKVALDIVKKGGRG